MKFVEAVAELRAKYKKADMSPAAIRGASFDRATRVVFKKDRGGVFSGRDADGTEVLVYFNDTANLICCTEIESDSGRDDE